MDGILRRFDIIAILALLIFIITSQIFAQETSNIKLLTYTNPLMIDKLSGVSLSNEYLKQYAQELGLKKKTDLRLIKTQASLSMVSYFYQHYIKNTEVESSQIVISLDLNKKSILQVYNNYKANAKPKPNQKIALTESLAFERIWSNLNPRGRLLSDPRAQLVYRVDHKGHTQLLYRVHLNLSQPIGRWVYYIDPVTGLVVHSENRLRHTRHQLNVLNKKIAKPSSPKISFSTALRDYQIFKNRSIIQKTASSAIKIANGTAMVFDPDPLTVLEDHNLKDDSHSGIFEPAYFQVELLDLMVVDDSYRLSGPWVRIVDYEKPDNTVSTSTNGVWDQRRGETGFNDVMAYYHIDQNQRYVQSLGFKGASGVQQKQIMADTSCCDDDDNSYYIYEENLLLFSQGCVDDGEDADVILHEYGHALQEDINPYWEGGDTGALGEGFADYWAGSYSLSKSTGFDIYKVFNWDGVSECWAGRVLNATDLIYDANIKYDDHQPLGKNGRVSDELWSAPLFMSLVELNSMGILRSEVDQIIIESHFGVASEPTIPDMALATVQAAKRLYPKGKHSEIFLKNFKKQKIL